MHLEQRRQAMLQLHLSDQQFYCLLRYDLYYIRGLKVYDEDGACMCVIAGTRTYDDHCLKSMIRIH